MDERSSLFGKSNPYLALLKYLAPVSLSMIAIDIGEQALNRSLASSSDAVNTLAGFGIAYVIIKLATGMLSEIKIVSIMLLNSPSDMIKIGVCLLASGCLVVILSVVISLSKLGYYLIDVLHGVPPNVGQIAKDSLLYLSVFPLVDGVAWLHIGVLLRFKYSFTVGFASFLESVVQVVTVVVLLQTRLSRTTPILIPVFATYLGTLTRLSVVLVVYYKCIHSNLHSYRLGFDQESVAVLLVCYPLGRLPYSWLNALKSFEPAFSKKMHEGEATVTIKNIRIFQCCCFLFSFMWAMSLSWIPGVATTILETVSDIDQELIKEAIVVLHVFSFCPILSASRAVLTGKFVAASKTKYLYPTIPATLIVLVSMLCILPRVGVHGSLMGACAFFLGFCIEPLSLAAALILFMRSESNTENFELSHKDSEKEMETEM